MTVHLCPSHPCPLCNPAPAFSSSGTTSPELLRLLERAAAWLANLTPEQREEHYAQQRRNAVKAEMEYDRLYGSEDSTVSVRPATP